MGGAAEQLKRTKRHLFVLKGTTILILIINLVVLPPTLGSKIAYKKALNGKENLRKHKANTFFTTTITAIPSSPEPLSSTTIQTTTIAAGNVLQDVIEEDLNNSSGQSNSSDGQLRPAIEDTTIIKLSRTTEATFINESYSPDNTLIATTIAANTTTIGNNLSEILDNDIPIQNNFEVTEQPQPALESTTADVKKDIDTIVPCICGVFLSSQIQRTGNPYESVIGHPVITNELERPFPCTPIGNKQCQTKCLQAIVQHLPNSANILCATVEHDIHKERAYLFIKNCRNQWYNTNLAAGREYCCKNGQPYKCPLV